MALMMLANVQGECGLSPDLDVCKAGVLCHVQECFDCMCVYTVELHLTNTPSTADTHNITDNSESSDHPYIHFDT